MLVILGVWRHVYQRFPLRYDPLYWGAVFPLGMYTVCTFRLAQVIDAPVLMAIPRVVIWAALLAGTAALVGLVRDLFARLVANGRPSPHDAGHSALPSFRQSSPEAPTLKGSANRPAPGTLHLLDTRGMSHAPTVFEEVLP